MHITHLSFLGDLRGTNSSERYAPESSWSFLNFLVVKRVSLLVSYINPRSMMLYNDLWVKGLARSIVIIPFAQPPMARQIDQLPFYINTMTTLADAVHRGATAPITYRGLMPKRSVTI